MVQNVGGKDGSIKLTLIMTLSALLSEPEKVRNTSRSKREDFINIFIKQVRVALVVSLE